MKITTIEIDEHSAAALANACKKELEQAKKDLNMMRLASKNPNVFFNGLYRCYLPPELANSTIEEIREQIDPWCSLVMFWESWLKQFNEAAQRVDKQSSPKERPKYMAAPKIKKKIPTSVPPPRKR